MKIIRSSNPILFFSKKEKEAVLKAIEEAEQKSSAEIRVHLERQAPDDILGYAATVFERLGMARTAERNGVLILLGLKTKRFAIAADQGIHSKVSPHFWDEAAQVMNEQFRQDRFSEGLTAGIGAIANRLQEYFPVCPGNPNELTNEISYSY